MKKSIKKVISILMAIVTIFSVSAVTLTASAASTTYFVGKANTSGKYYTIYNVGSKKMLNVYGSKSASNTNVTVYKSDNTSGQKCKFYSHGTMSYNNVTYTKYYITFKCATSCALNVYGSSASNGANVNIWKKSGNSTQDWIFEFILSKGGYVIRSASNPKYVLTATGSANSSNVCLKTYNSSNDYQLWTSNALSCSRVTVSSTSSNTGSASNSSKYNLCWPVSSSVSKYKNVTSSLGNRNDPISGEKASHKGIDIGIPVGSSVLATYDGVVKFVGSTSARGKYVVIYHQDIKLTSVYQHLSSCSVYVGQKVSKGQVIAKSGNTGKSTGPHLHFELVISNKAPTSVDCAWQSGAQLIDGHYNSNLINYTYFR